MSRLSKYIEQNHKYMALLIIISGTLLRLLFIGSIPAGLNQDEASAGYEAWALLSYGIDRNGDAWPVLFTAWGSGQNVLYSYLSIPFIALFGLNEISLRLAMGISGSLSLLIFWLLAREIRGKAFGLWALLILTLNPWHIMMSRWALESNLLPFMLLLGIYLLISAHKKPWLLTLSAAVFALSLYAYGTAFIFLPFFLAASSFIMLKRRIIKLRVFITALVIFLLSALPITLCNFLNIIGYGEVKILGITLPALTETRQSSVTSFGGGLDGLFNNFKTYMGILAKQSDGLPWNSIKPYGLLYGPAGMILSALGLISYIVNLIKKRAHKNEIYVFIALISALISALFIDANINRMNMSFIPLIWFQAAGISFIAAKIRQFAPVLVIAYLICGTLFARYYFTEYPGVIAPYFYEGLGEAISYADKLEGDSLWLSYDINMPYIYVLFYTRYPADKFVSTVEYLNPDGAFRWVSSFGDKYSFGHTPPEDSLCIINASYAENMEVLAVFGNYAVVKS